MASRLSPRRRSSRRSGIGCFELGRPHGLKPAGLGARDTLRTEVCYPLYGHELDETTTPIEAGLGFFVALGKGEFIGRPVLAEQKLKGVTRNVVAFVMAGKSAPPRPHYPIWSQGPAAEKIGEVASGTQSPTLGIGLGMACLPSSFAQPQTPLAIEIRGRRAPALVVPKPFYRKPDGAGTALAALSRERSGLSPLPAFRGP